MSGTISLRCNQFFTKVVFRYLNGTDEPIANVTATHGIIRISDRASMLKNNGSQVFVEAEQHEDQCGSDWVCEHFIVVLMCLSADDSVLDGFPLCSPLDAPDINHINQISQMKAHNKVNFIAVVVLALCVVTLLFVAVVGWLHKCHKKEVQEIRREEVEELREKVIEMQEMHDKSEKPVDLLEEIEPENKA